MTGSVIELPEDEALHLTRVLRLDAGDRIHVFNGRGEEWVAVVGEAGKRRVTARLGDPVSPAREARVPITLAVAVLKGDKMDDVVRDAVMLGVARIQPLVTLRTEVSAAAIARGDRTARWQRIAVASAKQCGRAVVPGVEAAAPLPELLPRPDPAVMLVEPSVASAMTLKQLPSLERVTLLVGPEGGWADQEVQEAAGRGAMLVTLGSHTLRADAVPIVAVTAIRVQLEDF